MNGLIGFSALAVPARISKGGGQSGEGAKKKYRAPFIFERWGLGISYFFLRKRDIIYSMVNIMTA
jgi:hypothetical protein